MTKKFTSGLFVILLLWSCTSKLPIAVIDTSLGKIYVEVNTKQAPITANNFLKQLKDSTYKNTSFYRVVHSNNQLYQAVKIEVVQGGIGNDSIIATIAAIEHETTKQTGLLHLDGTVSMARSKPGSASTEFFICINDQPELDYGGNRNPDGYGFAAFGQVIEGMDIVHKIQQMPEEEQSLIEPVIIESIRVKN